VGWFTIVVGEENTGKEGVSANTKPVGKLRLVEGFVVLTQVFGGMVAGGDWEEHIEGR